MGVWTRTVDLVADEDKGMLWSRCVKESRDFIVGAEKCA
jgi:hypothetical protein